MSRLDRHVNLVRNKMAMGTLLKALAWALLAFAFVVLLNILVDRFLVRRLPHWDVLFWVGLGVTIGLALAYAIWRRPTSRQAAVAIDDRLGLKEKFSTALFVRSSTDPFAAATVRDAEVTADNVSLHKLFPVPFPRAMTATIVMIVVTLLTGKFLGSHPLFAEDDSARKTELVKKEKQSADLQKKVAKAIADIDSMPAMTPADKIKIEAARQELNQLQGKPVHDEAVAQRSVQEAMKDMQAIKDKVKEIHDKALQAKNDSELFRSIGAPMDDSGPLADVQKDIAKGDFGQAAQDVEKALKQFDKEKPADQAKAADEMSKLAQQLNNIANNTQAQKDVANKLQQMGATQQQMNQLSQALQGAANGDKQAQQQVSQIANQIAQKANQQQGQSPQQQQAQSQQVQQMIKQMQGNANAQQTAQNMAAAASALAKQMQAQAKAGQQGSQAQGSQAQGSQAQGAQAQGSQAQGAQAQGSQAQGAQAQGSQAQGAQAQGSQAQGAQAQGSQAKGGGQGMADAKAQMQQQLQNLQEAADAQAEAQAQQQGGNGDNGQGNDGNQGNPGQAQAGGQGPWKAGDAQEHGNGSGGPGISDGGARPKGMETPVAFKQTIAASVADEKGHLLNSRFIKTTAEKGTSRVGLQEVVQSAEKDAADEVDQDRISKPEQAVVKRYFDDLKQDANPTPAPAADGHK